MPTHRTHNDFDHFDDWDILDSDEDVFYDQAGEIGDDWEDDGAIAEVRETEPIVTRIQNDDLGAKTEPSKLDGASGQVFSLLEKTQAKRNKELLELAGPSEDELSKIEEVGIDDYIDIVLAEEDGSAITDTSDDESSQLKVSLTKDDTEDLLDTLPSTQEIISGDSEEISELILKPFFEGVAVALPTLFDEEGNVEYKTTARLAKKLDEEIAAVFVATQYGEGDTLSIEERIELVSQIRNVTRSKLIVDISAPSVRQSRVLANALAEYVDAFVIGLNAGTKDPYLLCESIYNEQREKPIVARLEGSPDSLPISPEFLYDLPISGVIDSTNDIAFHLHLVDAYSGPIYIGSVEMLAVAQQFGATGVVLPHATIHADLVLSAFTGNVQDLRELARWERETGSSPTRSIKIALESDNLVSSTMRD